MTSTINRINRINTLISENIDDLIFILNEKFVCEYVNFKDIKGLCHINDFIHPKDSKTLTKFIQNTFNLGQDATESRIKSTSDEYRWYEIVGKRIVESDKKKLFLICHDITKYKFYENEFKQSQNRYSQLTDSLPEINYWKLIQSKEGITAVQKASEMLELVINNIPQLIYWKDKTLVFMGCNSTFAKINGFENPTSIIGRTGIELDWIKDKNLYIDDCERQVMTNNKPEFNVIESLITSKGNQAWFEINRIPLHDVKDKVVGVLVTYEDITKRKKSEQKLQESEEKYRGILENIKETYFEIDLDGAFTFFNDSFIELTGYQRDELIGVSFQNFVDEKNKTKIIKEFTQVLETERPNSIIQFQFQHKNGKAVTCESSIYLKYDSNGDIIGYSGIARDITEDYLLKQKLKESEQKYHHLFESSPYIIWLMDENGTIVDCNSTINNLLSVLKIEDIIGRKFTEVLSFLERPDDLIILLKERFEKFLKGEKLGPLEIQINRLDGKKIWLSILSSLVKIGSKTFTQAIIQDITDLKDSEEELKILNEKLEQIILERTKELRESEEKFRTIAEHALMGIQILQDNIVRYVNQRTADVLGYSVEEILNWPPGEFIKTIHPDDLEMVTNHVKKRQIGLKDDTNHYQYRAIKKNGDTVWLEVYAQQIMYGGRSADLGTVIDISDRIFAEQKLMESEQKFRHLYKNSPYGIVLLNSKGMIEDINSIIPLMFGYDKEDLIGKNYSTLIGIYPSNTKDALRELPGLLSQRRTLDSKIVPKLVQIFKKDGTTAWVQSQISTIELDDEIIIQLIIQDITEKTIAEEKLRESERQYRTTIDSLGDPLHVIDKNLKIILVNKEFENWLDQLNITKKILGKKLADVFPFLPTKVYEEYHQVFENGITLISSEETSLSDREVITETRKIPIFHEGGVEQIITIVRDITENKVMETQLIESEEKYRNMVNYLDVGFYKGKYQDKLLMHNQAANRILGLKPEDSLVGVQSSQIFINPETRKRYYKNLEERGFVRNFIAQVKKPNGEVITLNINAHVIYNSEGLPIEVEGTFMDITEKFMLEQELMESEKKLREQNRELMKLDEVKNDFITMAAHELKTPLISISGYTDYILIKHKNFLTPQIIEDLKTVQRNVKRLEVLMDQLLEVMKIDEDKLKLQKENINVSTLINDCLDELSYLINEKNLEINLDINHEIMLNVDTTRIFTVFTNLISNAIKFTPDYGLIRISAKKIDDGYAFEVKDSGIGLTQEELGRLFQKFERLRQPNHDDKITIKDSGTGLGLYITKGIVNLHGGKISATSEGIDKGSSFTFTLPS